MKKLRLFLIAVALCLTVSVAAVGASPVVFKLNPIRLTNEWVITGTITTDGTIGPLNAGNVLDWNFTIVQTTTLGWTEKNSNALNISGVSTDGKNIYVATAADEYLDGGALYFFRGSSMWNIPTNAVIADFTQLGVNLGYFGGIAGWQDELLGLNFVGLNQRNNTHYRAASALASKPNTFLIHVPTLAASPILMTMSGTITTDGTIGALSPQNILAWNIIAKNQDIRYLVKTGSFVLAATGLSSNGNTLSVDHAGGQFVLGVPGYRPTFVTLADFTDPTMPNGFANYYVGAFGEMGNKTPLLGNKARSYNIAKNIAF